MNDKQIHILWYLETFKLFEFLSFLNAFYMHFYEKLNYWIKTFLITFVYINRTEK